MPLKTAREWVELYETAIESIVTGTVSSYSIAGRQFTKHSLTELETLHRYWLGRAAEDDRGFVTYADRRYGSYEEAG